MIRTVIPKLGKRACRLAAALVMLTLPALDAARADGEVRADLDIRQASEWIMRILISLVTVPSATVDLDDPAQLRHFIESYLVRGFRT